MPKTKVAKKAKKAVTKTAKKAGAKSKKVTSATKQTVKTTTKATAKGGKKAAAKGKKKATKGKKKAVKKTKAKTTQAAGARKTRYFKLKNDEEDETHGRYSGLKPKQAANKAFTSLLKRLIEQEAEDKTSVVGNEYNFTIIECTRGRKHKEFHYTGIRKELPKPVEVKKVQKDTKGNDVEKTITYRYKNFVRKFKAQEA